MNPFSRNRLLEKFVVTDSYVEFNKNSTNGLLADTTIQKGRKGGRKWSPLTVILALRKKKA
jgi:hypothetical protein